MLLNILLLFVVLYTTQHVPYLVTIVDIDDHVVHYINSHITYPVAIVDCSLVSATLSFKDVVTVAKENYKYTADVLVISCSHLWTWKQFPRSENSTNQTTELAQVIFLLIIQHVS